MHYLTTPFVVKNTMMEKRKVQRGSTISQFSFHMIRDAAMITPTDWIRSPRI